MRGAKTFLSDFAVSLYSARWLMLPANQLGSDGVMGPDERALSDSCHIYLICQRPAVAFADDDFRYEGGRASGSILYRLSGVPCRVPFDIPFPLVDDAVALRLSAYPFRELHAVNAAGHIVRYLPAITLSFGSAGLASELALRQFEVLYVGQAFGDGSRSAFDRLKSHSTLQKILADASYNAPDNEIVVMMFEYPRYNILTLMDGRAEGTISDERDSRRFYSIHENPLSDHQQVCLAEAALIRYFSPKYNAVYKDSFPSQDHKILQQCYELDFTGLLVEIDTSDLRIELFSQRVPSNGHHSCNIDLLGPEDRLGFFHFSDGTNFLSSMPDVIR